jgi:hypothetical protein
MDSMLLLVLKISLSPLLVAAGSLAQRRWGQAVGGRIVGLPLTSLPLLYLLAVADGTRFAAAAATASLAGTSAQAVLTWAYARAAGRHGPAVSVASCLAAFGVVLAGLDAVPLSPAVGAAVGSLVLVVVLVGWPRRSGAAVPETAAAPSLVLRMALAGGFALAVSEAAAPLGAHLAGLVTALPVLSVVMFALTHREEGAAAAQEFAHGVARGSFSVIAALAVLAVVLPTGHLAAAFVGAVGASLLAQAGAGLAARRPTVAVGV